MGNLSSKRGEAAPNTTPTGLYEHCEWDPKVVRRLIQERKLAPISVGREEAEHEGLEECPICFLYYAGGLNRSRCCRKGACTECYLQVKRPNQNTTGPLSREEIAQEAQEQMKVLELKISMRKDEIERDRQRELEKEKRLKEREMSGDLGPPASSLLAPTSSSPSFSSTSTSTSFTSTGISGSTSAGVPSSRQVQSDSSVRTASVPSHSAQPSLATYSQSFYGSSYPPPATGNQHGFGGDMSNLAEADPDLDDLMLMEAIRLSLLDVQPSQTNAPKPSLPVDSDGDSDHTDGAEYNSTTSTTTPTTPTTNSTTSTTSTSTHATNPILATPSPPRSPRSSTPPSPRSPPSHTTPSPTFTYMSTTTTPTTTTTSTNDRLPSPHTSTLVASERNRTINVDSATSSTLTASSDIDNDTDSDNDNLNSAVSSLPTDLLNPSTPLVLNNSCNNGEGGADEDNGANNTYTTTGTPPNVNDFEPPPHLV